VRDVTTVGVVVLNWNGAEDTIRCLASLKAAADARLTVLVVDNGSDDGSAHRIATAHPDVPILRLARNRGFSGGNNAGLRWFLERGTDVIGVLNNDTEVEPGFLEPLVATVTARPGSTYASPLVVRMDEPATPWFAGCRVDERLGIFVHDVDPPEDASTPYPTAAVSGCCVFAHRALWQRVGLFDERYFLLFEDSDWSQRANAAGARAMVVPASRVRHAVSASFPSGAISPATYYYLRNGLLFLHEHRHHRSEQAALAAAAVRDTLRFARRAGVRPALPALRLQGLAVLDYLRGRFGPGPERVARAGRSDRSRRAG
jgi:GT2 family glycosyltransferase